MSEEEHIIVENFVNEDVDKGIELSILSGMALTYNTLVKSLDQQ
jgi:hypothetical protein